VDGGGAREEDGGPDSPQLEWKVGAKGSWHQLEAAY